MIKLSQLMTMNKLTIGMDLGDLKNEICVLDSSSSEVDVIFKYTINNTVRQLQNFFSKLNPSKIIIEASTHSPWISNELLEMGHEVYVANPRKVKAIWAASNKSDVRDAEMLARIGHFDKNLLYPIKHRGFKAQTHLQAIKARDLLVKTRAKLVNHIRSAVKAHGARISKCSTESFCKKAIEEIPEFLQALFTPIFELLEDTNRKIKAYEKYIESVSENEYPETKKLRKISGVGPITALAFILTIDDPTRFRKSRDLGPFLGMTPKRDQSGNTDKPLGITKAGNVHLRSLLVNSANYITGPLSPDSDLKRFAQKFGDNQIAKRKAKIAVARKLAVLMHRLWIGNEDYDPQYKSRKSNTLKVA